MRCIAFASPAAPPTTPTARRLCLAWLSLAGVPALVVPAEAQTARPVVPLALAQGVNRTAIEPFLRRLGAAAQLDWALQLVPFPRLLRMAERGEALGFGISETPERSSRLAFSAALFTSGLWAVSRRDRPVAARSPAELKGLRVCLVSGSHYGQAMEAARDAKVFEVAETPADLASRLRMLQAGRCDALLLTNSSAGTQALVQRLETAGGDMATLLLGPQALVSQPVQIATAKAGPLAVHLTRINAALQAQPSARHAPLRSPGVG